jgi:hypothetical protein
MGLTFKLGTAPQVTTNYIPKSNSNSFSNSLIFDNGTNVGIGNTNTSFTFDVTGTGRFTGSVFGDVGFRTKSLNGYLLKNDADSANLGGLVRRSYWAGGAALDTQIFAETGYGIFLNVNGSSSTGMVINSSGNVGIGTSVPQFTLALPQDSKVGWNDAGSAKRGSITVNSSADAMVFATGTSDTERMRITSGGNVSIGSATDSGFRLYVKGTNGLYIDGGTSSSNSAFLINDNTGGTQYLRVRGDGYLFSTPTYNNTWAGFSANMYIASDGSFGRTTPSSGRYKDNINDWNGKGLETILALKPKTFKYKKDYCETANIDFLGLIAEEVAEVSPYLAQYEKADRTGLVENVRYDIIVVPLIAAIQELSAKVSALENKS